MFLIMLQYKQPIDIVEKYITEHRAFLEEGYQKDLFVVSGPRNPRTGGIILSQIKDRSQLEKLIEQDPFYIHKIADFEIIEFNPVKFHRDFSNFIE